MSWLGLNIDWTAGWASWAHNLAGPEPTTETPTPALVAAIGWRYRCARCDVIGYADPADPCWCCDQTDQLAKMTG